MQPPVLKADRYAVHTGKHEYVVQLEPGDCQIDFDCRADDCIRLYLGLGNKTIPVGRGDHVHGRLFVEDAQWIMIRTDKKTMVAACVTQVTRSIVSRHDPVPCAVIAPEAPVVDLRTMVSRLVGQQLEEVNGPGAQEVDLSDIIEELPDDMDPEFGVGFMELDEDTALMFEDTRRFISKRKKEEAEAAAKKVREDKTSTEVKRVRDKPVKSPKKDPAHEEEPTDEGALS